MTTTKQRTAAEASAAAEKHVADAATQWFEEREATNSYPLTGKAAEIVLATFGDYNGDVARYSCDFLRYQRFTGAAAGVYEEGSAVYIYPDGSSVDCDYDTMTLKCQPAGTHKVQRIGF